MGACSPSRSDYKTLAMNERRRPLAGSCTPAHLPAAPGALLGRAGPPSLSCSSSFHPQRDSLATSSPQSRSSRGPAALPAFPPSVRARHCPLTFRPSPPPSWSRCCPCCDVWRFSGSSRGRGARGPGAEAPAGAPASCWCFWVGLPWPLSRPEGAPGAGEGMCVPACHLGAAGWAGTGPCPQTRLGARTPGGSTPLPGWRPAPSALRSAPPAPGLP